MCSGKYNMKEYKFFKKTTLEQAIENMKHLSVWIKGFF